MTLSQVADFEQGSDLPKQMANHLAIWCYLSNLDASHVVRTAMTTKWAVIPIIPRNTIYEKLDPLAKQCGFELGWYSSEHKVKK